MLLGVATTTKAEKEMNPKRWKIGELARRTGVSVRALRHYDAIGLLRSSARSASGYRLYDESDVVRLSQIKSLRHMGFSLEEAGEFLSRPGASPEQVVRLHLARLREQVAQQQRLLERLEAACKYLHGRTNASAEEFLKITEAITMTEKYYTSEQMQYLEERRQAVGEERIREVEAEWPRLMSEARAALERGDDPASETAQSLYRRWQGLVEEFTGGDAGVRQSLNSVYENEPSVGGMDVAAMREMFAFIQRASETAKG